MIYIWRGLYLTMDRKKLKDQQTRFNCWDCKFITFHSFSSCYVWEFSCGFQIHLEICKSSHCLTVCLLDIYYQVLCLDSLCNFMIVHLSFARVYLTTSDIQHLATLLWNISYGPPVLHLLLIIQFSFRCFAVFC